MPFILLIFFQPTCVSRPSWRNRGSVYTEYGVSIRCVRNDQTGMVRLLLYKPGILFVGHMQTVETQIRFIYLNLNEKNTSQQPLIFIVVSDQ